MGVLEAHRFNKSAMHYSAYSCRNYFTNPVTGNLVFCHLQKKKPLSKDILQQSCLTSKQPGLACSTSGTSKVGIDLNKLSSITESFLGLRPSLRPKEGKCDT